MKLLCNLLLAAATLAAVEVAAQPLPTARGPFPNVPQVPGRLLSGLNAPSQGRTAIAAYHGGVLFTIPELPSSQPNSDFQVRTWDILDPTQPIQLSQLGVSPMPVNAHGYFQSGEYLILGNNGPVGGTSWTFQALADGSLLRTSFPGLYGAWDRGHTFHPWFVGQTYRIYQAVGGLSELRRHNQVLGTWDHLGQTGVIGHPFLLGNLLIYAGEESRTGIATYDISNPANPVLLDVLRAGGPGGYWPELWAGGGKLYAVFPYRLDGNGFRVVDVTDPTDLRLIADRPLSGATVQYAQFQDEYGFMGDHKVDMRTFESVLNLDGANAIRPSDGGRGVDTSQFALPLGNLLVTGGIGPNQGMAIWAHQAAPDTRGPAVTFHIPRAGQTNYPVGAPISLIIHETLNSRTLVAGTTLIVRPVGGQPIAGTLVFAFDDIMTFTPTQPLQPDTTYEVVVPPGGIQDVAGNGIFAYSFSFSTGNAVNGNLPPQIQALTASTYPALPGQSLSLSAQASDPEGAGLEYRYDFGDGTPTSDWSALANSSHVYAAVGHYTVSVQVRDPGLSVSSRTTGIAVLTAPSATRPNQSASLLCDAPARRVWSSDADNGTVTAVNADTLAVVAERSVCTTPRALARTPHGTLWVACEGSDALVVVNESTLAETARIDGGYGSAPSAVAVAPDGLSVYAVFAGRRQVVQYRASDRVELGRVSLPATPRALAISADSASIFVTRMHAALDDAQVWRLAPGPLRLTATIAVPRFGGSLNADSPASGRGVANHLTGIALSPLDGTAWFSANKANTARGTLVGPDLSTDNTLRNLVVGLDPATNAVLRGIDLDNSDSASAVAFSPYGDYLLVALQGNNELLVLDALRLNSTAGLGALVGRFAVGAAPQGVCVDGTTGRSFVRNFLSRSVSVLETQSLFARGALSVSRNDIATVSNESLSATVLAGKRLFYHASDPRMSVDGYLSCAGCHLDGGSDGRTWDFTGRGEGLRNTTSLRGRSGTGAMGNVHWTANFDEIQDFENDIRGAFGGSGFMSDADFAATSAPLGLPKAGRSVELDALASYVQSLGVQSLPRSPYRAADGTLTAAGARGRESFLALGCNGCHGGPAFTNSQNGPSPTLYNVGTLRTTSGQRLGGPLAGIDPPTLFGLWDSAPYLHDGAAETLDGVFRASGGRVIAAESGSVRAGAIVTNQFTDINNDDSVRGRAYVNFNALGHAVDFANVDGGPGGTGAIEVRYSASAAGRLDLVVNGLRRSVDIVASGNLPAFRKTRWRIARLENVTLTAGATNAIAVEQATGAGLTTGIDEITISTAAELAATQPHRVALGLSAADLADLIEYLLQIDAPEGGDAVFGSGFE